MDYIVQIKIMQAVRKLNATQTSDLLNISKQTYSKRLRDRTFQVDDLQHLADVLGFDMEIVFTDRESGKKI